MEKLICPFCEKEFEGTTLNQVEKQLLTHKINKHSDKIKISEKK